MSRKTTIAYLRKVQDRMRPIGAFIDAGAGGWTDGDGRALSSDLDDRVREMVRELQDAALWATMHIPHHIGLKKREEQT